MSKKKPSKITPSKNDKNNLVRNDTSETSSSTKTRNEMESKETPDHYTGKRAEPSTPTKSINGTSARAVKRAGRSIKHKQKHG